MLAIGRTAVLAIFALAAVSFTPAAASPVTIFASPPGVRAAALDWLYNLDYTTGNITVFQVVNGVAKVFSRFQPSGSGAQGLAVDRAGQIYTTVTSPNSHPCAACVEISAPNGTLVARLAAPILPGAPGAPSLTDVSLDFFGNVYVSDYGQQAVYFYSRSANQWTGPTVVVQNSSNAASVLAAPYGDKVFVSGGCGFAAGRPYARTASGYKAGACFHIGTIAFIGGATESHGNILTPVDGAGQLVSISTPSGNGASFAIPDLHGEIGGIALADSGAVAYVADHHGEKIYAFARPANGWVSATKPKLLATYTGFQALDIIAVRSQ